MNILKTTSRFISKIYMILCSFQNKKNLLGSRLGAERVSTERSDCMSDYRVEKLSKLC